MVESLCVYPFFKKKKKKNLLQKESSRTDSKLSKTVLQLLGESVAQDM